MPSRTVFVRIEKQISGVLKRLERSMPGFRVREAQERMMGAVGAALMADGEGAQNIALIEAGCGVGKSVGYTVPGVLAAK